ncbi:sensor histidine kinase [Paenibacillus doosanensis]|uniref:histidine kinase n=1 Tax=Paenibacillus konkukensis TaxID=2020716 RepID=A0ABY4RKI1_9BACL|nr:MULTISPECIES: sensor histidine kinase [Paenibacillus]MCS7463150.1 sensor histidine kinase [Paenibacillus doosanensis]UQZ82992.1 putative sensor-like histidine kinase [Paenibacillus konkukensis]
MKIRVRLILSFLGMAIVPLSVVNVFVYHKFAGSSESQATASAQASLRQIGSNVDTYMKDMESIAKVVVLNRSISDWLHQAPLEKSGETAANLEKRYKDDLDIRHFLTAQKGSRPYIDGIHILSMNDRSQLLVRSGTNVDLKPDLIVRQPWWPEVLREETASVFVAPHMADYFDYGVPVSESIDMFYPIPYPLKAKDKEWVFVHMSADLLLGEFSNGIGFSGEKIGLLDKEGKVILGSRDVLAPSPESLIISHVSPVTGWTLTASIPYDQLYRSTRETRDVTLAITAIACLLGLALAVALSKHVLKPLQLLSHSIRHIQTGFFQSRVKVLANDEIGELSSSYNEMLNTLESLLKRVQEEERAKKDAQLKALQYQINPHFLYNTLNSVQWLAVLHGVPQIKELITSLIKLLQSSLGKKGPFQTLSEELEELRHYISIQQYRFGPELSVAFDTDADTEHCIVPRMILQPLVENSIFHGLEDGIGHIWIQARREGQTLMVSVMDDGVGMTPEAIEGLLAKDDAFPGKFSGIGIHNVAEKIKRLFGSPYGISIMSEIGQGTKIIIHLPVKEG